MGAESWEGVLDSTTLALLLYSSGWVWDLGYCQAILHCSRKKKGRLNILSTKTGAPVMNTGRLIDRLLCDGHSLLLLLPPLDNVPNCVKRRTVGLLWLWFGPDDLISVSSLGMHLTEQHLPAPTHDRMWQTGSVLFIRNAFACFHPCSCVFVVTFLGRPWHWYKSCPEGEQWMSWNTKLDFNVICTDATSPCISHQHHGKAEARQCCLGLD